MKIVIALFVAVLLVGSTLPQRHKARTATQKKSTPVQKVWFNSHCFDTVRCDREALWMETPDQSIWVIWKAEITTLFIREKGIEQEICLLPYETTIKFRQRTRNDCADCEALKDKTRAQIERWDLIPAPKQTPLDSPWARTALEALQNKNYQLDSLVEILRRRNTQ